MRVVGDGVNPRIRPRLLQHREPTLMPRSVAAFKKIERQLRRAAAVIHSINMKYIQRLHFNLLFPNALKNRFKERPEQHRPSDGQMIVVRI